MLNQNSDRESYRIYRYKYQQPQIESEKKSVLIVEDDVTLKPLWERVFDLMDKNIHVDWTTTAEMAEKLIRQRFSFGHAYNLVIADISLEGKETGLDLWNKYGEETSNFVIVTGHTISTHDFQNRLDFGLPPYFRKPLNVKLCFEIAGLLNSQ